MRVDGVELYVFALFFHGEFLPSLFACEEVLHNVIIYK